MVPFLLIASEGEMQTNQSCSTVRECIKLDLLLTIKQLFCSHLPQSKGDSWHLHFVTDAHPRNDTLNEHISTEQFTRLWGQRMYLLTAFSACFARIFFGQFNIVCILSMIKKYFVQSCGISMYHYDPSGVPYFWHLCAILPPTEQISGDFFILVFFSFLFYPQKLTNSYFNYFFLYCGLFSSAKDFLKGKCLPLLYDIISFFNWNCRCSIVLPCFVKWQSGRNTWCTHMFKRG